MSWLPPLRGTSADLVVPVAAGAASGAGASAGVVVSSMYSTGSENTAPGRTCARRGLEQLECEGGKVVAGEHCKMGTVRQHRSRASVSAPV